MKPPDNVAKAFNSDAFATLSKIDLIRELLHRCKFPKAGTPVNCAVSGGADSLALLVLASAAQCRPTAIHVDHGLREGSAEEAKIVEDVARQLGADFLALQARVAPGPNLEARARRARYSALPSDAMTGHTADDQAETVVLNLLRGAGMNGMAGMNPDQRRPILQLRRRETRALCSELGLMPLDDPSNSDFNFRRNRIRHELMPLLDSIVERDVAAVIARQADLFRQEGELLDQLAREIDPTDVGELTKVPLPLARRALRQWLGNYLVDETGEHHPPDQAVVDRALEVVKNQRRACDLVGGWQLRRSEGRLFLLDPLGAEPDLRSNA